MKITVKAKIDAGYHQGLNINIVQGESYTIDESQFGSELFERPPPEWLAPWERGLDHVPPEQPAEAPVAEIKSGGSKK